MSCLNDKGTCENQAKKPTTGFCLMKTKSNEGELSQKKQNDARGKWKKGGRQVENSIFSVFFHSRPALCLLLW